jgi:cobalamin biosynthesis protein CbiG
LPPDTVTALQSVTAMAALSPSSLWVGIGCKRGTSAELIHHAFDTVCRDYSLDRRSIAGVATLKGKEAEAGLLEFCQTWQWPISFLSAAELRNCSGLHCSVRVEVAVGTPSVAEAAALLAAMQNGIAPRLVVPKQSFQWRRGSGAVTLAIAQSVYPEFSSPDVC